ncbi:class V chitinase-like [Cornus florida]|uniref:class V chitinase-like n=1 Tax=Cornus florida TaxID=4283 RepID=UPI0028A12E25|nr:class V chitinase-like [Cornus florida]
MSGGPTKKDGRSQLCRTLLAEAEFFIDEGRNLSLIEPPIRSAPIVFAKSSKWAEQVRRGFCRGETEAADIWNMELPYSASGTLTWIKAGYWYSGSEFPTTDIISSLFTHLICAYAGLNSSTYQLSISASDDNYFSTFTDTIKQKNPSVVTLLSIGGGLANSSLYSSMISQSSSRQSFIQSSIITARFYGFHGLDFCWVSLSTESDMANMAILLDEWRIAIESESRNFRRSQHILTMAVHYSPYLGDSVSFPIEAMWRN